MIPGEIVFLGSEQDIYKAIKHGGDDWLANVTVDLKVCRIIHLQFAN